MFIKQRNADVYVVNVEGFENDLTLHPAIANYPDLFEVVEGNPPGNYTRLIFSQPSESKNE